jgi:DNA-binding response OmpR family regulator
MKAAPHILVIDDENYICESCDRIFSKAGYRVDTNISATKGFRQALMNPYDVIILDLNLVESDGMKLLYGIRKRKPDIPVVIITGYPSEDSRRMSTTLGVTDYITKPFEPAEILEPVQRVISSEIVSIEKDKDFILEETRELNYHFYLSSWFHQMGYGIIRVGGYLPNLSNSSIISVKLPELGSRIYRGLPLAEVTLSNGTKQIIPSSISGKIKVINNTLRDYHYNLEINLYKKNWIAIVEPEQLEQDLKTTETRNVLVFADKSTDENEFFRRIVQNGYVTKITTNIDEVVEVLSEGVIQVLVVDARQFGDSGPEYVQRLNQGFPDIKIIVFNEPNLNIERSYRKNSLFYYGVNPISNHEMVDLLHCAFTDDNRKIALKNPRVSRFLPDTISKISMTNRYGTKVTLFAYNEILQNNGGLGYLLTKELLDMEFPLEIHHSRCRKSIDEVMEIQNITIEKEKNDRIIILQTKDMDKIPGSISKDIQEYTNKNALVNLLINIFIQPASEKNRKVEFDANTTIALKDIIMTEIVSG